MAVWVGITMEIVKKEWKEYSQVGIDHWVDFRLQIKR